MLDTIQATVTSLRWRDRISNSCRCALLASQETYIELIDLKSQVSSHTISHHVPPRLHGLLLFLRRKVRTLNITFSQKINWLRVSLLNENNKKYNIIYCHSGCSGEEWDRGSEDTEAGVMLEVTIPDKSLETEEAGHCTRTVLSVSVSILSIICS